MEVIKFKKNKEKKKPINWDKIHSKLIVALLVAR